MSIEWLRNLSREDRAELAESLRKMAPPHTPEHPTGASVTLWELDNDAFRADPCGSIAALIRGVADRVESGERDGSIRDVNGNTVGCFQVGR